MPLMSSRAGGSVRAFGLTILSALNFVLETFNRSDQAGLGSVRGQRWRVWRGTWAISGNKASSSSPAGDNALATLKFTKTDVTVSVSGADPGVGAAFWVTDANNWYASVYTQTEVCQTCSNCNAFSGGTCNQFSPGNCSETAQGNCRFYTFGNCNAFTCSTALTPGNCRTFNSANTGRMAPPYGFCYQPDGFNPATCNNGFVCQPGAWNPDICYSYNPPICISSNPDVCISSNPVVCNAVFTFSCNCTTEHRISLLRFLSGTVSTISSNLFSSAIQSFKIILNGNQATIQSFSNNTYTSQIGNSVVESINSPQKTTQHGIIKSTSSFQQGSSIDEFGVS